MTEGLGSARAATILGLVGVGPPAGPRYWRLQRRGGGWNATAWAAFQGASVWAACQWQWHWGRGRNPGEWPGAACARCDRGPTESSRLGRAVVWALVLAELKFGKPKTWSAAAAK